MHLNQFSPPKCFRLSSKSSETSPTRLSSLSSETSPKSVRRSPSEGRPPKALRNRSPPKPLRNLPFRSHSPPKALTSHDGYFGVGVKLPTIEVRYADLRVAAECQVVYGKPLPTLWNSLKSLISDVRRLPCFPLQDTHVDIINDVSGIIKPGRVWENYTIEIFIRKLGQITQAPILTIVECKGLEFQKTVFNGQPTAPDYDNIPYAVFWFCIIFYHLLHKIESGFA
ncbi:hypothetical protein ACS0TY_012496 [Phlomoides rotata]